MDAVRAGDCSAALQRQLTGITAAGARIGIPVNEVYGTQENPNTSKSFTISADDWQYAEVELTVTRLGQAYGEVGLSTTKKYAVKQRLERPGQPLVINPDTNELEYTIGWSAIGSEKRLCRLSDLCAAGGRNGRCPG